MHHFTLVTSASLFEDNQQRLWQEEIPLQASSCPLLMHGILAIAALHLALSTPAESSSLLDRALHHHTLSLQLFNRQITTSNSSNAHLHFSYTVLLIVWAYGSVVPMDDQYLQLDGLLDSLELVRLGKSMFELHSDDIRREAIGQFAGFDASRAKKYISDTVRQALTGLRAKADDFIDSMAIDHMEHHLQFSETTGDVRFVIGWPAVVENAFWARIRSHKPVAMLILAHYSMLLAKCKEHHWWISGWAGRVLLAVENILPDSEKRRLDWETHRVWIRHEMMRSP
ncbi:hypothetical protein MW887_003033 [Aspergillus wentii]|nr:hypothetical protein MW887_003033 [Aspergillus wentii]